MNAPAIETLGTPGGSIAGVFVFFIRAGIEA
jgi:hypothetical protein